MKEEAGDVLDAPFRPCEQLVAALQSDSLVQPTGLARATLRPTTNVREQQLLARLPNLRRRRKVGGTRSDG